MPTVLEFWPECNGGPIWTTNGKTVDPRSLELCDALYSWNAKYGDSLLPFETNDREWLDEGVQLLARTRAGHSEPSPTS